MHSVDKSISLNEKNDNTNLLTRARLRAQGLLKRHLLLIPHNKSDNDARLRKMASFNKISDGFCRTRILKKYAYIHIVFWFYWFFFNSPKLILINKFYYVQKLIIKRCLVDDAKSVYNFSYLIRILGLEGGKERGRGQRREGRAGGREGRGGERNEWVHDWILRKKYNKDCSSTSDDKNI